MATITYIRGGDLLSSKMHTLVNTVNCQGYMGKGLALQFKERYPQIMHKYEQFTLHNHMLLPGHLLISREYLPAHLILNFATKDEWYRPSRIEWIEGGLVSLVRKFEEWELRSIAISKLGCGNGQLPWESVGPLMASSLKQLPESTPIEIYINTWDKEY